MNYLCRNGHPVKHSAEAGLDCPKCKANEKRRRAQARASWVTRCAARIRGLSGLSVAMATREAQTLADGQEQLHGVSALAWQSPEAVAEEQEADNA
jgi:hypothetical protein